MIPSYTIACFQKKQIAPGVYEIRFTRPQGFDFQAGQFVLFDVPLVADPSDIQPRAYSMASSPAEPDLLFVIKLVPGGRTSCWVEKFLSIGTQVVMKGPFGIFTPNRKTTKPYLFLATGSGIAPFRSHIKWLLETEKDARKMDLVFGIREKSHLFWTEHFSAIDKSHTNFSFHVSLASGEPGAHGHSGKVQDIARALIIDPENISVYVCGSPELVTQLKKLCIEEWGVPKADVHAEGYV